MSEKNSNIINAEGSKFPVTQVEFVHRDQSGNVDYHSVSVLPGHNHSEESIKIIQQALRESYYISKRVNSLNRTMCNLILETT